MFTVPLSAAQATHTHLYGVLTYAEVEIKRESEGETHSIELKPGFQGLCGFLLNLPPALAGM